jgi:hypothetical protein
MAHTKKALMKKAHMKEKKKGMGDSFKHDLKHEKKEMKHEMKKEHKLK